MSAGAASRTVLPVQPFRSAPDAVAEVPGSKSISNRALLLAFLCSGKVRVRNLLDSDDTRALREAFDRLGVEVASEPGEVALVGCSGIPPSDQAAFDVRNAGTVARFLPAALSLCPSGNYRFDGSAAMRRRPMAGLLDSLRTLGAEIVFSETENHYPFLLRPAGWRTDRLRVDASRSSQILSGLLIAATRAPGPMRFELEGETVSKPFVEMTLRMIRDFGGRADRREDAFFVEPGLNGPAESAYSVEPDATAASYFFALPLATGGKTAVSGFPGSSLQGDLAFLDVLRQCGLDVGRNGDRHTVGGRLSSPAESSDFFLDVDFNAFSDTFLTLAALTPLFPGPVRIRGIGHTRHQETDRVAAMAAELRKLGQEVDEQEDSLTVLPRLEKARALSAESPVSIDTYEDHRVAMSFGILGCNDLHRDGRPWIAIRNPECCGKTFPKFFDELARLRTVSKSVPDV